MSNNSNAELGNGSEVKPKRRSKSQTNLRQTTPPQNYKKISKRTKLTKAPLIPVEIDQIKKCTTKNMFKAVLVELSEEWKDIIRFYLTECYIFDLYTRKIEDKKHLLSKREILYNVIDNPTLLDLDCHFDNNLMKNFCTGLSNFLKTSLTKMKDCMKQKK